MIKRTLIALFIALLATPVLAGPIEPMSVYDILESVKAAVIERIEGLFEDVNEEDARETQSTADGDDSDDEPEDDQNLGGTFDPFG